MGHLTEKNHDHSSLYRSRAYNYVLNGIAILYLSINSSVQRLMQIRISQNFTLKLSTQGHAHSLLCT